MGMITWVQIMDKAVFISSSNSTSSYGLVVGQTELFNFSMATSLKEKKTQNSNLLNPTLKKLTLRQILQRG